MVGIKKNIHHELAKRRKDFDLTYSQKGGKLSITQKNRKINEEIANHELKMELIVDGICIIYLKTTVSHLKQTLEFESERLQRILRDVKLMEKLPIEDYRVWHDPRKATFSRITEKNNW